VIYGDSKINKLDIKVDTDTGYRVESPGKVVLFTAGARDHYLFHSAQTDSRDHPKSTGDFPRK
jgi:hypothetical protein